jgi:hypothetical protein
MNAPRRISRALVALASAAIVAGLLVQPTPAEAASTPELTLSAFGTARIDGVLSVGEWDRAARIDFEAALPLVDGGGSVPASIYVMNDATNLYLAASLAAVPGCAFYPNFEFDNDNDGDRFEIGNDWVAASFLFDGRVDLIDMFMYPAGNVGMDTVTRSDYPPAGTIDLRAAGSHPGGTTTWVEMSHPLDSADDLHDFSLEPGDTIGFVAYADTLGAGCGNCTGSACRGSNTVPAQGVAHIRVATAAGPTPTAARSWTAAIAGGGISGGASLRLPATGSATAAFSLYRLRSGVSVSARILAGATCDAITPTITRLPGYTTTVGGTWRQQSVLAGAGLVRLRSAIRSGTPLWFDVKVAGSHVCARLAGADEITGNGLRGSVAFGFHVILPQFGKAVGRFDSSLKGNVGVLIRGDVDCGWVKGSIGVLGGLMDGADPASPNSYFTVMVSDGPDGIIIGTGRPRCGIDGFGDPRTLAISSGEIVVIDR